MDERLSAAMVGRDGPVVAQAPAVASGVAVVVGLGTRDGERAARDILVVWPARAAGRRLGTRPRPSLPLLCLRPPSLSVLRRPSITRTPARPSSARSSLAPNGVRVRKPVATLVRNLEQYSPAHVLNTANALSGDRCEQRVRVVAVCVVWVVWVVRVVVVCVCVLGVGLPRTLTEFN